MLVAVIATAISVALSVSFEIVDPDLFQHLLVGKAIWQMRSVPVENLWTWPQFGEPYVLPSWLFRALVWPVWAAGGVEGLFGWRWLTTLTAFGLAWFTARRMGARGFLPLAIIALCALTYRSRSLVRPETLVAVLLAAQIFVHESRRQGGTDRSPWLVLIALLWANAHVSYHLGLLIQGIYLLDAWWRGRAGHAPPEWKRLALVLAASIGVSFLNPFGWRALWQPFEYILFWRGEPIYLAVQELRPIDWPQQYRTYLPVLFAGWPLLMVWRAVRGRFDRIEAVLCVMFSALAWTGQRFLGPYAIVAAVFASRSASEVAAGLRVTARVPAMVHSLATTAFVIGIGLPIWLDVRQPLGITVQPEFHSAAATDFMAANDVAGRGFNSFELAGWMLYRFWPERERLPFMDIHQTGTTGDRFAYAQMLFYPEGWRTLDDRHHFDYALLSRRQVADNVGLNTLDADTAFALVFVDDVAALYARREGPLAAVARRSAYAHVPGGDARLNDLQRQCAADSAACATIEAELTRAVAASPHTASLRGLLANIAAQRGALDVARAELLRALETNPNLIRGHERLGIIALAEGRPRDALEHFREERRRNGALRGLHMRMGHAAHRLGDTAAAARHYRIELERYPGSREAADSLAALE